MNRGSATGAGAGAASEDVAAPRVYIAGPNGMFKDSSRFTGASGMFLLAAFVSAIARQTSICTQSVAWAYQIISADGAVATPEISFGATSTSGSTYMRLSVETLFLSFAGSCGLSAW